VSEAHVNSYDGTSDPFVVQLMRGRRLDDYQEPSQREVTPTAAPEAAPEPVTITPFNDVDGFFDRFIDAQERIRNAMVQSLGVPPGLLMAPQQLQEMHRSGEANTVVLNQATPEDLRRAWENQAAENDLVDQMRNDFTAGRQFYADLLGRPVSADDYLRFRRIGDMLSAYTRVEEQRDANPYDIVQYIRADDGCRQPALTYEQTPRLGVRVDERNRTAWVVIENRDTVPEDLSYSLQTTIDRWPLITARNAVDAASATDRLIAVLREKFRLYLRGRNRNYLSYYFVVRRDMNELTMEEVREWTGSVPNSVGQDALQFPGTAGLPSPPLYNGFTTKVAWSSDEIAMRQRDPRLRSDQVESLLLRLRDICRTRNNNFTLDECKFTLNASAPVVNACRTFVFKLLTPTDRGLQFRLLVRLFQKIDAMGLSRWGYQIIEENDNVVIRPPRAYNNPEAATRSRLRQDNMSLAEEIREQARRSAAAAMHGQPNPYPPPQSPPRASERMSIRPDDEPLPEGRPLDL
jgi:hypothetical protein